MRRALLILLKFTPATGHIHPHLQGGVNNYRLLLEALPPTAMPIPQRLAELGAEAGWDARQWRGWLDHA